MAILRLVFPQWQGSALKHWDASIQNEAEMSYGYSLGAYILNLLANDVFASKNQKVREVFVKQEQNIRQIRNNIIDYETLLEQFKNALVILEEEFTEHQQSELATTEKLKLLVLGGDSSVTVPPLCFLNKYYQEDVALIWFDAHFDNNLPQDGYPGFHAMTIPAILGKEDIRFAEILPSSFKAEQILQIGVRDYGNHPRYQQRMKEYGITVLAPEAVHNTSNNLESWLKQNKAHKAIIHFDLDVLNPEFGLFAMAKAEGGLSLERVSELMQHIAQYKEIVGISITEYMPRHALALRKMLANLPL